jgi:hypothetical protein
MLKPAIHKSFAVDSAIASGIDCCAACEFFDGYLCRGEDSPLYKRDVDPTAKCPEFQRQGTIVASEDPIDLSAELAAETVVAIDDAIDLP